jgi:hypothetical protein
MLAKADRSLGGGVRLICADCGHSVDPVRHGDQVRRSWLAVVGLAAIGLLGCLALAIALLNEAHHTQMEGEPAASERAE